MKFDPAKTALLVVDMQKDFYADGGNAVLRGKPVSQMQALPKKITEFAARLRGAGAKIVFTKFIYDPAHSPRNYAEIIGETKDSNWLCKVGTDGAEFAGVQPTAQDTIIEKLSYDSFAGTGLLQMLKQWGIENVIVTGVRTEICVLYTTGRCFAEGFRTIVATDLVGTYDDKAAMAATVLQALKYSTYVLPSSQIMPSL